MKKYLSILLLIAFIVPSIVFASLWNPFSWFSCWSFCKSEITQQSEKENQKTLEEKNAELQKQIDELKNQQTQTVTAPQGTTTTKNTTEIKPIVDVCQNIEGIQATVPSEMTAANKICTGTTIGQSTSLQIYNAKSEVSENEVDITWNTNIPSESRLFLTDQIEKGFESESGLSTNHKVKITNLVSSKEYNYKITATTQDKKGFDDFFSSFIAFQAYTAFLGKVNNIGCQTIVVTDTAGRIVAGKSIKINSSYKDSKTGLVTNKANYEEKADSNGEISFCAKGNTFVITGDRVVSTTLYSF